MRWIGRIGILIIKGQRCLNIHEFDRIPDIYMKYIYIIISFRSLTELSCKNRNIDLTQLILLVLGRYRHCMMVSAVI